MKLIIVPTDFSPLADNALKFGMDMATTMGTSLMLVNVYQLPVSYTEVPLVTISLDEIRKISEEKLAETKRQVESITAGKLKVYTESKLGDTSEELKLLCETLHPFAVIMGTRGVTGLGRLFLGSNTMAVINKVSVPVFVIPPGAKFNPIKKMGLATDLKDVVDNSSVEHVKQICQFFQTELHVLNVDFERSHFTAYTPEESLYMDSLLSGLNPIYNFIENKDVEEGISEFSEKNNLDLIVLFPKKHSLLESLFEKSHTRDLIHHTHIPLMCIHPSRK